MAQQIPVLMGHFGSTPYYLATMKAAEAVRAIQMPREVEGWENLSPEERYQREVNLKRVREHIAPYLARDKTRFFGSLIVTVIGKEPLLCEPLTNVISREKLPVAYQNQLKGMGILHLGAHTLVPLDGQHRLAALRMAITGKDEKNGDLNFHIDESVKEDDVTLILIEHDPGLARKIFNKVNQYAKPTSKGDNLITDDDNICAIIARSVVKEHLPQFDLVTLTSNSLTAKSGAFTTLATIYESTKCYMESVANIGQKIDTENLPSEAQRDLYWLCADDFWVLVLKDFKIWSDALDDRGPSGNAKRAQLRDEYVCLKPIIQRAIIEAIGDYIHFGCGDAASAIKKLNNIDWRSECPQWKNVFFTNKGTIISGSSEKDFARRIVGYMLGIALDEEALLEGLRERLDGAAKRAAQLPSRV